MQRRVQLYRQFVGEFAQQAHHALAMLVDGQAEAEPEFGVILKQRVGPRRAAAVGVGSVRCRGQVAAVNGGAAGGIGNQHSVAVQLGQQFDIRRFATAGAGAGVFKQRADQLRSADINTLQFAAVDFRQVEEVIVIHFLLFHMLQAGHHIDGLDLRILAIFCRAHFHAQVAAGAVFRGDLQYVFLPAHIAGLDVQRVQTGRGVLHLFRCDHFGADRRVRAGGDAVVALRTQRFLPDGDLFGDVAFLPARGAHGPGAVRRQGGDRQRIAETGQHRGGDRFDEIRRGVGDHRRAVRTAGVHRLERYFRQ